MADNFHKESSFRVPEREIAVPGHLSPEAQAFLSMPRFASHGYPALDDTAGWKQFIASSEAIMLTYLSGREFAPGTVTERREGGALAYEIVPEGASADDRRVYLDIHGGALIMGAGEICKIMAQVPATLHDCRVVSVDYRTAPEHPYPASLDDCMTFYRALLKERDPSDIVIGGGSAGGNLVAATILRARDEGLPLPAAAVLISPEVDLTESGDSFRTNAGIDPMGSLMEVNLLYANGADLSHPYLSPLLGDFTKGFPPTLITAGTRDLFLSNAVRLHRKLRAADIPAELHILEAAPHGAFAERSPEEAEVGKEIRGFCARWWRA
jgi:acetyl esterase/lipase